MQDQKKEKEKLKALKKRIMAKEKNNFSNLYLFPSGKTWYKMGWNSALIYKYILAPKMEVDANLRPDRDFEHVSRVGIISFQNLKLLEERLSKVGVKKVRVYDGVWIFELDSPTSEGEIQRLCDEEAAKWKQASAALVERDVVPEIWKELRGMNMLVVNSFKVAPEPLREYIERDIMNAGKRMMLDYIEFCNKEMKWPDYCERTRLNMHQMKKFLRMAMEVKAWELKNVMRLVEMMRGIEQAMVTESEKRNVRK